MARATGGRSPPRPDKTEPRAAAAPTGNPPPPTRHSRDARTHVKTREVGTIRVCGREGPEFMVVVCGILRIAGVVLRDRLHGPLNRVVCDIFHDGVKSNFGRF